MSTFQDLANTLPLEKSSWLAAGTILLISLISCGGAVTDDETDNAFVQSSVDNPLNAFIQSYEHNPHTGILKVWFNRTPTRVLVTNASQSRRFQKRIQGRLLTIHGVACSTIRTLYESSGILEIN